jgi:hypothetical protein
VRATFDLVNGILIRRSTGRMAMQCKGIRRIVQMHHTDFRHEDIVAIWRGEPVPPHLMKDGSGRRVKTP